MQVAQQMEMEAEVEEELVDLAVVCAEVVPQEGRVERAQYEEELCCGVFGVEGQDLPKQLGDAQCKGQVVEAEHQRQRVGVHEAGDQRAV